MGCAYRSSTEDLTMCHSCFVAQTDPNSGLYTSDCHGCEVRALSKAPPFIRKPAIEKYPEEQRQALEDEVRAEYNRRQVVRRSLGM
jgi:hypothetical protein